MASVISRSQAEDMLREYLLGDFVHCYSQNDAIELCFSRSNLSLIAQTITSPIEGALRDHLAQFTPNLQEKTDSESVAIGTILSSTLRRSIQAISVTKQAEVEIDFSDGIAICIATHTDIVDWQWSLGVHPQIPYSTPYKLACFHAEEMLVSNNSA